MKRFLLVLRTGLRNFLKVLTRLGRVDELARMTTIIPHVLSITLLSLLAVDRSYAGSATWNLNPTSGDWNTAANWTPQTVPNGPSDIATFDASNTTSISISVNTEVDAISFDSDVFFTISASPGVILTLSGTGVTPNPGFPNFTIAPGATIQFTNSAMADASSFYESDFSNNGELNFVNNSSTGFSIIKNNGGTVGGGSGGLLQFKNNAVASYSIINLGGTVIGAAGGMIQFFGNSKGEGLADIDTAGGTGGGKGAITQFFDMSVAPPLLFVSSGLDPGTGGSLQFFDDSTADGSSVDVGFGYNDTSGNMDISAHNRPGLTVASIGDSSGTFLLGSNNLTVGSGSNGLEQFEDGGIGGGTGGSLTKVGADTLVLGNGSSYTGGTLVTGGTVMILNSTGSATGSGPVRVSAGTLAGHGMIAGQVVLGTGSGAGAFLSPGQVPTMQSRITISNRLIFNADATYNYSLNSSRSTGDSVAAKGIGIHNALFSFTDNGAGTLPSGKRFVILGNTSHAPISGTFSNLPDGSSFTVGSNTYSVSYSGGDGNDLTLTVVP